MSETSYFSRDGFEKLKQELHELKTRKRAEIAAAIAEAREKGDLSENAEYDAAKEAQGLLEMNIAKLETMMANARIMDDRDIDTSRVHVLSTVQLMNRKTNKPVTYQIVSPMEADLKAGKISVDSPIGKGLLGLQRGDVAKIEVPAGVMEFEVLDITR